MRFFVNERPINCKLEYIKKMFTFDFLGVKFRLVTRMMNMLNVRSPHTATKLNDPDRETFRRVDDDRFEFLENMAGMLQKMHSECPNSTQKYISIWFTSLWRNFWSVIDEILHSARFAGKNAGFWALRSHFTYILACK